MKNIRFTDLSQIEKILNGTIACHPGNGGGHRLHDDHDGTYSGNLWVGIGPDGDTWVNVTNENPGALRFRNHFGGGDSPRVHNALLILAYAISMDNATKPQTLPKA